MTLSFQGFLCDFELKAFFVSSKNSVFFRALERFESKFQDFEGGNGKQPGHKQNPFPSQEKT